MEAAGVIDFSSAETHLLLNPRLPAEERARLERMVPPLRAHILVATSGTSGSIKLVALSKAAVLASAAAVNEWLEARAGDVWCRVLPEFHVGGLGILARAHLTGSRVIALDWDPLAFAASEATLASLVPAQVHDLLRLGVRPASRLRAILVGGGVFESELQERARSNGWPVLATYGMSECGSTVAVSDVLLSHLEARSESDGRLALRGASLFTGYATEAGLVDPKVGGWFISDDLGVVEGRRLRVLGRRGDFVKVGGESVDLKRLDHILDGVRGAVDAAVVALPDARLGHVIHLAVAGDPGDLAERFNARVLPFERMRGVHRVERIPRTSLGKLLRRELIEDVTR
ncbi:MAG TPA: AMP-binding protein [Thermoanaerobaculia bacterium]|nr:AMP-binding protein [Thermoanaerobaculia bacterium]